MIEKGVFFAISIQPKVHEKMSPYRYMMISTVACDAGFLEDATRHLNGVMGELAAALPTVTAYFGTFMAGRQAGSLALIHLYQDLADVDPAFGVYGASPHFAAAASSGKIALRERNLIRLAESEHLGNDAIPEVQVFLRYTAPGPSEGSRATLTGAAMASGSSQVRTGTIWTGAIAGSQLIILGCQSVKAADAVEAACRAAKPDALPERDLLAVIG